MDHAPGQSSEPVSVDDRIGEVADRFLAEIDNPAEPNRNRLTHQEEQEEPSQEAETGETEEATDETTEDSQEATSEEESDVEINGKAYRLPKELAELVTEGHKRGLREADYTRKTQEVAEGRKQVERMTQAAGQFLQQAQQFAPYFGQVQLVEQQIQEIGQRLTPDLETGDPIEFNKLQTRALLLMQQRQGLMGQLHQAHEGFQQQMNAFKAQQLAAELPKLAKEIPGFENRETRLALAKWGADNGLSEGDLQAVNWSPGLFRVLHMAKQFQSKTADDLKRAKEVKAKVQSLPAVKPTGRSQESPESRDQKLREDWRKGGGKLHDSRLDAILDSKLKKFGI